MPQTIDEYIDSVQQDLTVGGLLPKLLDSTQILSLIEKKALPYFYKYYKYSTSMVHYLVDTKEMKRQTDSTGWYYIKLPCEIQAVTWVWEIQNTSLFNIGINAPNLSINLGVTNQPYLSSYVTTVAELGVYKATLDNFSDTLDILSKFTVKFDYNDNNNIFSVLTSLKHRYLVLECEANIQSEYLFDDPLFYKYTLGLAKQQMGRALTYYDFQMPGGVKYNGEGILSEGKEEIKEVEEAIKAMGNSGFIFLNKR